MIEVLIALEEPLLQVGVEAVLDECPECHVAGTVGSLEEVEASVQRHKPDVVLLDVQFQKGDRELIPRLVDRDPDVKVIVLVEHSDEECAIRALLSDPEAARFSEEALENLDECCLTSLRSSARGCVPRTADPSRLIQAVRTVAAGEIAAAPWLTAIVNRGVGPRALRGPAPISVRELDVIRRLAEGMGNKEIAKSLGIKEQTVKNHVANIMQKLGAKSRLEVGIQAVKRNLASSAPPSASSSADR
ncbi:MAG: response regulator transcription factor [Gemmatimonadota bacterium]|jgi:DNA-binding NarL/FixJ family response regulator